MQYGGKAFAEGGDRLSGGGFVGENADADAAAACHKRSLTTGAAAQQTEHMGDVRRKTGTAIFQCIGGTGKECIAVTCGKGGQYGIGIARCAAEGIELMICLPGGDKAIGTYCQIDRI